MSRFRPSHRPGGASPHRHLRLARIVVGAFAFAAGCALSAAFPPETTIPGFSVSDAGLPR